MLMRTHAKTDMPSKQTGSTPVLRKKAIQQPHTFLMERLRHFANDH
jgi:hypothetical protein